MDLFLTVITVLIILAFLEKRMDRAAIIHLCASLRSAQAVFALDATRTPSVKTRPLAWRTPAMMANAGPSVNPMVSSAITMSIAPPEFASRVPVMG